MGKTHSILLVVQHPSGLHARPASKFVQLAAQFPCQITVQKINSAKQPSTPKVRSVSLL